MFLEYLDTGNVRRFPTAILSFSLDVVAVISIATGLILDLVAHVRREAKKLSYLSYPAPRQALLRDVGRVDRRERDAS